MQKFTANPKTHSMYFIFLLLISTILTYKTCPFVFNQADEIYIYMRLAKGETNILGYPTDWGPFYATWRWVISLFTEDVITNYDINYMATSILLPLSLYILLVSLKFNPSLAFFPAALLSANSMQLFINMRSNHFAIIIIFLATAGLIKWTKGNKTSYGIIITGVITGYIRPEYFIVSATLLLIFHISKFEYKKSRLSKYIIYFSPVYLGIILFPIIKPALPIGNKKDWAFRIKIKEWYISSNQSKNMSEAVQFFDKTFPKNPQTIIETITSNPMEILHFWIWNLKNLTINIWTYTEINKEAEALNFQLLTLSILLLLSIVEAVSKSKPFSTSSINLNSKFSLYLISAIILTPPLVSGLIFGSNHQYLIGTFSFLLGVSIVLIFRKLIKSDHPKMLTMSFLIYTVLAFQYNPGNSSNDRYQRSVITKKVSRYMIDFNKNHKNEKILLACEYISSGFFLGFDQQIDTICCSKKPGTPHDPQSNTPGKCISASGTKSYSTDRNILKELESEKWGLINFGNRESINNSTYFTQEQKLLIKKLESDHLNKNYRPVDLGLPNANRVLYIRKDLPEIKPTSRLEEKGT